MKNASDFLHFCKNNTKLEIPKAFFWWEFSATELPRRKKRRISQSR